MLVLFHVRRLSQAGKFWSSLLKQWGPKVPTNHDRAGNKVAPFPHRFLTAESLF